MTDQEALERLRACLERMKERSAAPRRAVPPMPMPTDHRPPPRPFTEADRDVGEEG